MFVIFIYMNARAYTNAFTHTHTCTISAHKEEQREPSTRNLVGKGGCTLLVTDKGLAKTHATHF